MLPERTEREVGGVTHGSAIILVNTRGGGEGIDEKVVVVTSSFPHGEPKQVVLNDKLSLGSERLWVIIRNHQLLGLVINEGLREREQVRNHIRADPERTTLTV